MRARFSSSIEQMMMLTSAGSDAFAICGIRMVICGPR